MNELGGNHRRSRLYGESGNVRRISAAIFRHPVCKSNDEQQQLRVRRGLGTRDEDEAQGLVNLKPAHGLQRRTARP